jgi:cytidyltransferase-like protein
LRANVWADCETTSHVARRQFTAENKINYRVFTNDELKGFPEPPPMPSAPGRKKIIATGCYDWFHSGHVRFTEEASAYGDLYVCLGSDANVRLLKGEGHPHLSQAEWR